MADVTIGARLQLDANDGIKSLKDLKNQIREAKGDLVGMTQEFGATSEQARIAAKRVAELEDNLGDAKKLVDAFNPDQKFRALGQALNGVLGGFTALTGAMGLLGVESADVQKQLLKVQSALALSQGLNQIGESINSFKNLGKTIVATLGKSGLIGVAIAGVAALGAALAGAFSGKSREQKELENSLKELGKASADATKEVYELNNAFKLAASGGVREKEAALKQYNEGIGKTVGFAKDLNEAEKLTAENAKAYIEIQGLKAQANYILGKSAELAAKATIAESESSGVEGFGGIFSQVPGLRKKAIQGLRDDSEKYLSLVDEINAKIQQKSAGFSGTSNTGGGKATTVPGKIAEKETKEQELIYSTYADNALQRDIDFRNKLIENRRLFIEAGRELEEAEFNEKIALLNLELDAEEAAAKRKEQLEQITFETKQKFLSATANLLSSLSTLIGEQTAAGKVFAVAEATINTYAAIAGSLRAFAGKPIPGYAIIQAIATGIFGLAQVKKILSVPVPGKGGSGGVAPSISSISAPIQAQSPLSQRTRLDDESLNQIGNATVRAFVVESDVTNNQERIRRLNRAARIG